MLTPQLIQTAIAQASVLSRGQLLEQLTSRQIDYLVHSGKIDRVAPGAYALCGAMNTWDYRAHVALASIPGSVLSGRAAARVWKLPAVVSQKIELNVERSRRRKRNDVRVHGCSVHQVHVTNQDGFVVTTIERTLVDLVGRISNVQLSFVVQFCLQRRMVTVGSLRAVVSELPVQGRGLGPLREILDQLTDSDLACESFLEKKACHWLAEAGFPPPVLQKWTVTRENRFRPDLQYPDRGLIIEVDGPHHLEPVVAAYDRRRRNELTNLGRRVLVFGLETTREDFLEVVAEAWRGTTRLVPD